MFLDVAVALSIMFADSHRVIAVDGNIALMARGDGAIRLLTNTGRDRFPSLSKSGFRVVYTRDNPVDAFDRKIFVYNLTTNVEVELPIRIPSPLTSRLLAFPQYLEKDLSLLVILYSDMNNGMLWMYSVRSRRFTRLFPANAIYRPMCGGPKEEFIVEIPAKPFDPTIALPSKSRLVLIGRNGQLLRQLGYSSFELRQQLCVE